jgi:hypothetical protein
VIDEISLVGVKMFNVVNNMLRSIKHIQNNFFGGVDVIMIDEFYQAPLVKDSESFKISKIMLMHYHQFFGKHMSDVMNQIKLCLIWSLYKL